MDVQYEKRTQKSYLSKRKAAVQMQMWGSIMLVGVTDLGLGSLGPRQPTTAQ